MENGDIPNAWLSASSSYNTNHGPERARLNQDAMNNYEGAWVPSSMDMEDCWIQVTFPAPTSVSGVILQGRSDSQIGNGNGGDSMQWVKQFYVNYTEGWTSLMPLGTWQTVTDEYGEDKV